MKEPFNNKSILATLSTNQELLPGQTYLEIKSIGGTKDYMSPEVMQGYVIEDGAINRKKHGFKYMESVYYTLEVRGHYVGTHCTYSRSH